MGVDVARAVALVAMMATHILPDLQGGAVTAAQQVAGGRASALFALLAGVSIALTSGRGSPPEGPQRRAVAAGLAARAVLIALVGLVLGHTGSGIAVILTYYGVLFLLAIPFLGLRARPLFLLAGAWVVVVPALSHLLRPALPRPSLTSPSFDSLADPGKLLVELLLTGYYPALPWLALVLAGMALGRTDLAAVRTAVLTAVAGGWLGVAAWMGSDTLLDRPEVGRALLETFTGPGSHRPLEVMLDRGLYGTTPTGSWWWLAVRTPHTATPFELAHTIGTSMLVIGIAVLAGRALPRLLSVAFGAGAMTLSLYSLHVVLRSPGAWDADTTETYVAHAAVALVLGAVYRLAGRRGPLEAAVAAAQGAVRRAAGPRPPR